MQNQYVSGGTAQKNLDLMLNCFMNITNFEQHPRTCVLLSNVNAIVLRVFCNGDSEDSLHLVGTDYPILENQLEIQSRLKKQVIQHEVFNLAFLF